MKPEAYVSRGGLKLASVTKALGLNFKDKIVLDVGSSTGGFTDYALQHGAKHVIAIDAGKNQLHPSLRTHPKVELHEQTDIRDIKKLSTTPDIVVIDVSFISIREILPSVARLSSLHTEIVAMVKPQFEVVGEAQKNRGVIKNDRVRREILKQFEQWTKKLFIITNKADSKITGVKGNVERFYVLRLKP